MRGLPVYLSISFFMLLSSSQGFSQDGNFRPSRTEAEAAWDIGNYEAAYQHYNGLLLLYSRDPSYKYYTGACLVKLQRDLPRAVTLLGSAINSSVNVKTVPDDVWFHYGRALQMDGRFKEASDAFNKFVKTAGKRAAQEFEVQKYLDQCARGEGLIAQGSEPRAQSKDVSTEALVKAESEENITVPEDYDMKLTKAVKMQYTADSLNRVAQGVRRQIETAVPDMKEPLRLRAEALEKEAAGMQAEADKIFFTLEPGDQPAKTDSVITETKKEEKTVAPPTLLLPSEEKKVVAGTGLQPVKGEAVYSILEAHPSPAYSASNPIPVGKGAPQGLVYRIQLAAFKNPVAPGHFKGLYPLYGKVNPSNGITYYYTGMFRTLAAGKEALPKVRATGFTDAFIVAMMDDTQVSMERAALLEKEWGKKPLFHIESAATVKESVSATDSIPMGTLSFRAEVLRSKKPVKPEVTEKIELLAGRRGLDIIKNSQGETLYLVGNFITFESADEYVSLLIRNGYSTARVAAYVGIHEIPVEAAKELLNRLLDD